ncbi:MAG TPA: hypothetical protein VIQ05_15385 [Tardiphaga sp.]
MILDTRILQSLPAAFGRKYFAAVQDQMQTAGRAGAISPSRLNDSARTVTAGPAFRRLTGSALPIAGAIAQAGAKSLRSNDDQA